MVVIDVGRQLGQLVPVRHIGVFRADAGVVVVDVCAYQLHRLVAPVELYAAVQVAGHAAQPFQPAVEARLELCPRRHRHLYAPQRVERLYQSDEHYLAVQPVVEALYELAPELGVDVCVDVHAHDDFRGAEFAEGVLDAVGNVGGQPHLRLHVYVAGRRALRQPLQQPQTLLAVGGRADVVVHHVQCHQPAVQLLVAHHDGQLQQLWRYLGIFHAEHDLLVVGLAVVGSATADGRLPENDLLRGVLGHHGRDDAGDEYHDDHAVQHLVVHQVVAGAHLQLHAHHDHRNGTGSVGAGQSEHHVARRLGQPEQQARQVGRHGLAEGAEEGYQRHYPQHVGPLKQRLHVDEHADAYQEVGYEQCVAYELDAVHQGRHVRYVPVQNESGQEGTHNALDAYQLRQRRRQEHDREHEDVLHDGVRVAAQEVARQLRDAPHQQGQEGHELQHEQQPEAHARLLVVGRRQGRQHHQRHEQRQHGRPHTQHDARVALQSVARDDGVGYQRVRRHDAAQQKRCRVAVAQHRARHAVGQRQRNEARQHAEHQEAARVLLHALQVHLQSRQEHDVQQTHLAEQLERRVAHQHVQPVLSDDHARQHHADDVRNAQLAHDDGGKQDNHQHDKEYQCRARNREI